MTPFPPVPELAKAKKKYDRWKINMRVRHNNRHCDYSHHVGETHADDPKTGERRKLRFQEHSVLKQYLRQLEYLCGRDHEGFCWADEKYFLRKILKPSGATVSKEILRLCRNFVVSRGWYKPDTKMRQGRFMGIPASFEGLTKIPHERFAIRDGCYCTLRKSSEQLAHSCEAVGKQLEPQLEQQLEIELVHQAANTLEHNDLERVEPEHKQTVSLSQPEPAYSAYPAYPDAQAHAKGTTNSKTNGSLRSFQIFDHDQKPAGKFIEADSGPTVGDALSDVWNLDDLELIERLSDGEFNTQALTNYEHTGELGDKCREAVQELSASVFRGRPTLADVMGLAMERLRKDYNYDAPKGWLLVMRRLRQQIETEPAESGPPIVRELQATVQSEANLKRYSHDVGRAEDWFTLPYVERAWAAVGKPSISDEWRANLVETAREIGSPTEHKLGLASFLYESEKRFGKLPDGLKRMYNYVAYGA
jgi:hypothetical protein